jgi:hypothetical protein
VIGRPALAHYRLAAGGRVSGVHGHAAAGTVVHKAGQAVTLLRGGVTPGVGLTAQGRATRGRGVLLHKGVGLHEGVGQGLAPIRKGLGCVGDGVVGQGRRAVIAAAVQVAHVGDAPTAARHGARDGEQQRHHHPRRQPVNLCACDHDHDP